RNGVCLAANSETGARDYEAWLGLRVGTVPVVRNAFMPARSPGEREISQLREELGLAPDSPVVLGVFRLEAEKRPHFFLDCAGRLRDLIPEVRIFIAGVGSLEAEVRAAIVKRGLADTVRMLGQRADVPALLAL